MNAKEVAEILTLGQDAVRAPTRADFAGYLEKVFSAAERVPALEARIKELETAKQ